MKRTMIRDAYSAVMDPEHGPQRGISGEGREDGASSHRPASAEPRPFCACDNDDWGAGRSGLFSSAAEMAE